MKHTKLFVPAALFVVSLVLPAFAADPLASWNDTAPKRAIAGFVEKVTTPGSPDFVPVAERIATFDNDGTLWAEHPMYFQLVFALDCVKALAPHHRLRRGPGPAGHGGARGEPDRGLQTPR